MIEEKYYFLNRNDVVEGPFEFYRLRAREVIGEVTDQTLVVEEGGENWKNWAEIKTEIILQKTHQSSGIKETRETPSESHSENLNPKDSCWGCLVVAVLLLITLGLISNLEPFSNISGEYSVGSARVGGAIANSVYLRIKSDGKVDLGYTLQVRGIENTCTESGHLEKNGSMFRMISEGGIVSEGGVKGDYIENLNIYNFSVTESEIKISGDNWEMTFDRSKRK